MFPTDAAEFLYPGTQKYKITFNNILIINKQKQIDNDYEIYIKKLDNYKI